jgi:uncharacterized membrane protein YgcG
MALGALRRWLLLVTLMIALGAHHAVLAQDRSLIWERWDVEITNVDVTNNSFDVREIYDVRFFGAFRFGTAVIPANNLEAISRVFVLVDGQPLRSSCSQQAGTYCFEQSATNEYSITYFFPQIVVDEQIDIEIAYTVYGALRIYEGGDQLWWDAIPEEHFGYPILRSTVTIALPEAYAPREGIDPIETYGAAGEVAVNGSTVTAPAVNGVDGDEGFSVRVQYPHNPRAVAPSWQAEFDARRAFEENVQPLYNLGLPVLALLLSLGGSLFVVLRYLSRGRDPEVTTVIPEYLAEPPSDLSPGVVGTLLDERADVRDVIAVVMDLARRGYIVIEETRESGFLGIVTSNFTFKRTDKSLDGLRRFEQLLVQRIFDVKLERTLESLRNRFYTAIPEIQRALYAGLVEDGLFEHSPAAVRTGWSTAGSTLLILAFGGFFLGTGLIDSTSPAILCIPASLGIIGLVMLSFGAHMPAKTEKGALEAAKWRAFRIYMRNLEQYASLNEASERLATFIPYAIAFNMSNVWLARFRQTPVAQVPPWYYPTYLGGPYGRHYVPGTPVTPHVEVGRGLAGEVVRADDGSLSMDSMSRGLAESMNSMATGLESMINSAARVMTSQPQASGSSGRWRSGGGSFSGGGFRGGGGSGGGSRGFG